MTTMTVFSNREWALWPGAERFDDGSDPLVGECLVDDQRATVIAHGPGIYLAIEPPPVGDEELQRGADAAPETAGLDCGKEEALHRARELPTETTWAALRDAGFRAI